VTTYLVRTDLTTAVTEPDDVRLLDWAPARTAATIQTGDAGPEFFAGWLPPRAGADLLLLGAAVYCADKTTRRRGTPDSWTRNITLRLPIGNTAAWEGSDFEAALGFLTGDHWRIRPYDSSRHPLAGVAGVPDTGQPVGVGADGVCLFSGGLDSLCGVVDLLEDNAQRRLCLLSHHEGGQASTAQQVLLDELTEHYGADRITSHRLYLRPAPANNHQARPLPRVRENTTRSRSLLFLSAAFGLAAAEGPAVPVYVPENGFIGINVPLTRARVGSASTRTTHPHFMSLIRNSGRHQHHCRSRARWPEFLIRLHAPAHYGSSGDRSPEPGDQPVPAAHQGGNAGRIPQPWPAAATDPAERILLTPRNRPIRRPQARQLRVLLPLSDPALLTGSCRVG